MTRRKKKGTASNNQPQAPAPPAPPEPLDVVDGIPDRSSRRPPWKYVLIATIFIGWICFMVICAIVGAP